MSLTPYKPNQGLYARGAAAGALLLLDVFMCVRLVDQFAPGKAFRLVGMEVPTGAAWAGGLFLVFGAMVAVSTLGLTTGVVGVDGKVRGFVDLLIEAQNELQKVSWPSKDDLRRSTAVVLVCIVVIGCFLFVVDLVVNFVMTRLGVLPS